MCSTAIKIPTFVGLLCVLMQGIFAGTRTWGDIDADGSVFILTKSKLAIPFITRELEISYPDDFPFVEDKETFKDYTVINGIEYYEYPHDSCEPQANVTKGGIGQAYATVKVTSPSGCGIDSRVTFRVQKPEVMRKE